MVLVGVAALYGNYQLRQVVETNQAQLEDFGPFPEFTLVDDSNKNFGSDRLLGKITLLQFFFSNCGSTCPMVTQKIKSLSDYYSQNSSIQFISISIDPTVDTPALMRNFRESHGATNRNWAFLTGKLDQTNQMLDTLKLTKEELPNGHTTRLVLVDQSSRVRGYYSSLDDDLLELVKTAISGLD